MKLSLKRIYLFSTFVFLRVLEIEPMALYILSTCCTTKANSEARLIRFEILTLHYVYTYLLLTSPQLLFFKKFLITVYLFVGVCASQHTMQRPEDSLQETVLALHHVVPRA